MAPPPPPDQVAREALLDELRCLETPELLALCLRFGGSPARLFHYLEILRSRAGGRAQLAASLVCYDLARQGNAIAQRQFAVLAPTMLVIGQDTRLVGELLAGDAYLVAIWSECLRVLEASDPREAWDALAEGAEVVGELELLSDEDLEFELGDLELEILEDSVDPKRVAAARDDFVAALVQQFGHEPGRGGFRYGHGLATSSTSDLDRLEAFLNQAAACAPLVPAASGMACLGNLFLATHLRRHTLFGRPTPRRVAALKRGLLALPSQLEAMAQAAEIFGFEGREIAERFEKVTELMLDYLSWCGQQVRDPRASATVEKYVAADRVVAPLLAKRRRRR